MVNVVSFSGGRTSAYMVYLMEKMRKEGQIENVEYVFMDTGAEHPETYDFVRNVINYFEIDLVCLRTKINEEFGVGPSYSIVSPEDCKQDLKPWHDMLMKYGAPYTGGAFCTDRMKTVPYRKYCDDSFGKGNYCTWLGIRSDEPRRINLAKKGFRYLAEISPMTKGDIIGFWQDMPFDLDLDEHLGNCVFCLKKSDQKIALAVREEPEMAAAFDSMLKADDVRTPENKQEPNQCIYRQARSMDDIIKVFDDVPTDYLQQRMKPGRGNCEESCEVFGCQDDLFKSTK